MGEEEKASGRGDVTFQANGKTYTLRPYLGAAKGISSEFGGLIAAYGRVRAYDFNAMARMVAYGLDKADPDRAEEVEAIAFAAGLAALVDPLCSFIERLGNRGLPLDPTKKPEAVDGKKNASRSRNTATGS